MKKAYMLGFLVCCCFYFAAAQAVSIADTIAEAVNRGDCITLYEYITQDKTKTETRLVTSATNALRRYTQTDTSVAKYRNDSMDARIRRLDGALMEAVFTDPENTLPDLAGALVKGLTDQFLKAKALHDWICDNIVYDTEMYFSIKNFPQDYISVLKKKTAVCEGYANLYNKMCTLAGLESMVINGYSKGFGYRGAIGDYTDHAWNAVKLNNKWYLVDVTWNAGYVDARTFVKKYSTAYLFLDSRSFLYSHLPEKPEQQFYAPAVSAEDFQKEAFIAGIFFQYGLEMKAGQPLYNNFIEETFSFEVNAKNANLTLSSELRTNNQQNVDGASWLERTGNNFTFYFDVPDSKSYKGYIFARIKKNANYQTRVDFDTFENSWLPGAEKLLVDKKISEEELDLFKNSYLKVDENKMYYFIEDQFDQQQNKAVSKIHDLLELPSAWMDPIFSFNIKAAPEYAGYGNSARKYPFTYSAFKDAVNTKLQSPLDGVLKPGETVTFTLTSRDYSQFALRIDEEFSPLFKKLPSNKYELQFDIPEHFDGLAIYGSRDGKSFTSLVKYEAQ
ncbi:MAG: hypothetical protein LBQ88_07495 [Treponema sp.]|jgi:hypothetical protein|nr:hypothetical protein [Treponema sp.]